MVDLAVRRRLGQHPRRLLERGRRDERTRLQAGLGDTLKHRLADGPLSAVGRRLVIGLGELLAVDLLADQIGRVAGVGDLNLLQHLADDHLDVLIVDLDPLEPVDALDLAGQIIGQRLDAQDLQDVVRHRVAVHQVFADPDVVALLDRDVLALGDQVFPGLGVLVVGPHDDPALVLVILAELDLALDLADDRVVFGLARLEQLRDPRQAARDVARLGGLARDAGEHVAGPDMGAVVDRENGVHRHEVTGFHAVGERDDFALLVAQRDPRLDVAAARLLLPVDHDPVRDAGGLVQHLAHGDAFDQIDVVGDALLLGDDRDGIGIPIGQLLPLGHLGPIVDQELGPVGQPVTGALAVGLVDQDDLEVAAHDHRHAFRIDDHVAVLDLDPGLDRSFDAGLLRAALGRAADVEGPHGELGARLADRLGRYDADRLADVDPGAPGQVAAVAARADTALGLAEKRRADPQAADAGPFHPVDSIFLDQLAGRHDDIARERVDHVLQRGASQGPLAQRGDHLAALDHGLYAQTLFGAAVLHGDDGILGDVDQTPREIARVRGLERGVGQALAGAVGGVEVLQHGQAFLEVGDDRRLDDLARGLGHESAHAGQLLDLRRRAAGAGVRHHEH